MSTVLAWIGLLDLMRWLALVESGVCLGVLVGAMRAYRRHTPEIKAYVHWMGVFGMVSVFTLGFGIVGRIGNDTLSADTPLSILAFTSLLIATWKLVVAVRRRAATGPPPL